MSGICPDAEVIDLSHEIRKYSIRDGALAVVRAAVPARRFPRRGRRPGRCTARRRLATDRVRRLLIGPDNGLLVAAADATGIGEVRELENPAYRLPVVTSTFHGRDVFAPAAAHLAAGAAFETLGPPIDPAGLVGSPLPAALPIEGGGLATEVIYEDTFGNLKLSALVADVRAGWAIRRVGRSSCARATVARSISPGAGPSASSRRASRCCTRTHTGAPASP